MHISAILTDLAARLAGSILPIGATFSLTSLQCAFVIAFLATARRRRARGRKVALRPLLRMLFPRKTWVSASCRADVLYFLFNTLFYGAAFGWTILSYKWISLAIPAALNAHLGSPTPYLPPLVASGALTVVMFLAYELGYWIDHRLSHEIPALWEIHKVHHTAEHLTPLTVWRVHPLETLKAYNIIGIFAAMANGSTSWALGEHVDPFALNGRNILIVMFMHLYVHLQHSSVWIAFPGIWGRIFLSPAHHQLHHSRDIRHFNGNLGSCLAIWDTLFGTLRAPTREPQKLHYGVEGEDAQAHGPIGLFVTPALRAFRPVPLAPQTGVTATPGV